MRAAALLLWLIILSPVAQAADWLTWRKVGDATLTWGPFTVYTSQLRTPEGRYSGENGDRALIITYARDIDRDDLVEATRDQSQRLDVARSDHNLVGRQCGPAQCEKMLGDNLSQHRQAGPMPFERGGLVAPPAPAEHPSPDLRGE